MIGSAAGYGGGRGDRRRLRIRTRVAAALAFASAFACADEPTGPPGPFTVSVAAPHGAHPFTVGDTLRLEADVRDAGREVIPGAAVSWSSSDARVASVGPSGVVTAVGPGTATITAASGGTTGSVQLSVGDPAIAVLWALYAKTGGGDWTNNDNWLSDADLDNWYGVDTDSAGRVVGLDLRDNNLMGHIPPELGDLGNLRRLVLDRNRLTGPIPNELGTLSNLTYLALWSNELTGDVPIELGNLQSLDTLFLRGNELTGDIPVELGNLQSLRNLDLGENGLTGKIPPELGGLGSLRNLELGENGLTGKIPPELGGLGSLRSLRLNENGLTGKIPPELGGLGSLESLWLGNNELTGSIPPELGGLVSLRNLELGENGLTGKIPPELGNLLALSWLGLSGNELTGEIPPELGNLANLWLLNLDDNRLRGAIPVALARLGRLHHLRVSGNDICLPTSNSVLVAWLEGVDHHDANGLPSCGDRYVLEALYDSTGGASWTDNTNWKSHSLLNDWFGVTATAADTVTEVGLARNNLVGVLPTDLGDLGRLRRLIVSDNRLSGAIPPALGNLAHLTLLDMSDNQLSGGVPPALGNLANLTLLDMSDNQLSGVIPVALARLGSLEYLLVGGNDACLPRGDSAFVGWLNGLVDHDTDGLPSCTDRHVLEALYDNTTGPNWEKDTNWKSDRPLDDWYGVTADTRDRVLRLDLRSNGLTGTIPAALGSLESLMELNLDANGLTGSIPPELGNLEALQVLGLWANELTGSIPPELGSLESLMELNLDGNELTGPIPPELGNLEALQVLGLWANELTGSIPPELGNLESLRELNLYNNELTGPIPPELGNLESLRELILRSNDLTGSIPPELGNLRALQNLSLVGNDLTGPIPPELGNLEALQVLGLWANELTGSIPPELGNLHTLEYLTLNHNELTGPIPPELGNLHALEWLKLDNNNLTGSLPPELGKLSTVEYLWLQDNDLAGPVPPEIGGMSSLKRLILTNNTGMTGPLPAGLTTLRQLERLLAGGTQLCAPSDSGFQEWLNRVHKRRIRTCATPPAVYLSQAVQSREFPVPLVAGERALLRVFVTARQTNFAGIPPVRARFYRNGRETHVEEIPGKSGPIPTEVDESSLSKSANAEIPAEIIQPGLEMVIDVDPNGTLDASLGVARRIPREGRLAVDVQPMPVLDLTLVPFVWAQTHDSSIVNLVGAMAADSDSHEMLEDTRTLLPVGDLNVTAHEPVLSSSNHSNAIFAETRAIRALEGGKGHYMGMMSDPVRGARGTAERPGRVSFSGPYGSTIAHELGHNMSLMHAPCNGPRNVDPSFPYPDGSVGAWGYSFRDGGRLVRPSEPDLMSYCHPRWISDYGFTNALGYRLFDEGSSTAVGGSVRSLLLWGGVSAEAVPHLEPVFVVEAAAALPDSAGEYQIIGRTETGAQLFALRFAMAETADGDGSASFAFVLPVRTGWAGNLARITLTGPGGSFTLDGDSDIPMAILRNAQTGQIRGILRDPPPAAQAAAGGQGTGTRLEVLFSRGIPGVEAWRR